MPQTCVALSEETQVGEARRAAAAVSRAAGLGAVEAGKVAIVVNELARNVVRHGGGGEILLQEVGSEGRVGVEAIALDRGAGMDIARSMRDGMSTGGSRGEGLGAVQRLSHEFDVWSAAGGTAIVSRIWSAPGPPALQIGAVCQPLAGEHECGDAWAVSEEAGVLRVLVADGLGHGPAAAIASREAVRIFGARHRDGPEAIVRAIHEGLRGTRGAAVAVAELDTRARTVRFAGIGNVAGSLVTGEEGRGLVSHNGTAGVEARRVQEFGFPWDPGSVLVLSSDGINTHFRLEKAQGLAARHAAVIAAVAFRDFRRKTDDATVVVVKQP